MGRTDNDGNTCFTYSNRTESVYDNTFYQWPASPCIVFERLKSSESQLAIGFVAELHGVLGRGKLPCYPNKRHYSTGRRLAGLADEGIQINRIVY